MRCRHRRYGFVNNYMMGSDATMRAHLQRYTRLLKTDLDVFLTGALAGLTADKILVGYGGYMSVRCGAPCQPLLCALAPACC